jgi:TolA-binding protein
MLFPFRLRLPQSLLSVFLGVVALSFGQDAAPAPQFTANEMYLDARRRFNEGDYAGAAAGFNKFKQDFGSSTQAAEIIAEIRYPLAVSLLNLQKFDEASVAIGEALDSPPPLPPAQKEELSFWKGVCLMQADAFAEARIAFEAFCRDYPRGIKVPEAQLLIGTTLLLEGKFAESAAHFAKIKPYLQSENRGRATVLQLYALLEARDNEGAMGLVVEEFPRIGDMLQIATFQTLSLQLGSTFLEQGRLRDAIICLQRVWSRDRLLQHQQDRLEKLEQALAAAEAQPNSDSYRKFHLRQMITKVRRELENFEKIEDFDAALRLRLATAFLGMDRYREAALILEEMLTKMPPSPIVESASVTLVQSWMQIERWSRVEQAALAFEEKFPESPQLPMVLYLRGTALQQANDQVAAIATFDAILDRFPDSDFAARAQFMKGFSQLLAEQNAEAVVSFDEFAKKHPDHELREASAYWRGMGYSLNKQFPECRDAMDAYLAKYPTGTFAGLATFRKAYAGHSMMDYTLSIKELPAYLAKYPGHESRDEALILYGDALMNEGEIDRGIAAYKQIDPANTRFFEEGWFKTGQALRLLEDPDAMRAHFEQFQSEHPRSPRVAEAVYWIGWTHRQADDTEKARAVYWDAIDRLGNDATIRSVEDLFQALSKLYRGEDEQRQYVARLRDLNEKAIAENQKTLAMRSLWAQGQAFARPDPVKARELMVEASKLADIPNTNPLILADIALAMQETGRINESEQVWKDLIKWNPRAPQKDRAFFALANIELQRDRQRAALDWLGRFERETSGSVLAGSMFLTKGKLLMDRGDYEAARTAFGSVLTVPGATGEHKAQALFFTGETFMAEKKPELAIPYFQRIYIMHGRWTEWVARAYFRSGEAFEAMNDNEAARKTYDEMTRLETIQNRPETDQGRSRLQALGGPVVES